jgi:hypothetical protein
MRYTTDIHYKGEHQGDMCRFRERIDLEFTEQALSDAPVAVEWSGGCTRWHDGRHFMDFGVTFDRLAENYLDLRVGSEDRMYSAKRYPLVADTEQRANALRHAANFVNDCIVIDGKPWLVCAEPTLWASPNGLRVEFRFASTKKARFLRFNETGIAPQISVATFRVDEVDEALRVASEGAELHQIPVVHIPSSINSDPACEGLLACARTLCDIYADVPFSEMNPFVAAHLAELRATMWNLADDEINLEQLADRAVRAVNTVRTEGRKRGLLWMDRAVERWHERPIGPDILAPVLPGSPAF